MERRPREYKGIGPPYPTDQLFKFKGATVNLLPGANPQAVVKDFDHPEKLTYSYNPLQETISIYPKDHADFMQKFWQIGVQILEEKGLVPGQLSRLEQIRLSLAILEKLDIMGEPRSVPQLREVSRDFPKPSAAWQVPDYIDHPALVVRAYDYPELLTIVQGLSKTTYWVVLKQALPQHERVGQIQLELLAQRGINVDKFRENSNPTAEDLLALNQAIQELRPGDYQDFLKESDRRREEIWSQLE